MKESVISDPGTYVSFNRECHVFEAIASAGGHPNVLHALAMGTDTQLGKGAVVMPALACNLKE